MSGVDHSVQASERSGSDAAEAIVPAARGRFLRRMLLWMVGGMVVGTVGTMIVLRIMSYDPTPSLTPEKFDEALERWKASAPANYDIEIRVSGAQAALYRVQVRDGQPQAAWRNGHALKQRRTFGTWSIPGMFGTISRDVEAVERRLEGRAGVNETELILRASFDPKYSYPVRYQRIEWGSRRGSTATTVTWEVVEFRVRP